MERQFQGQPRVHQLAHEVDVVELRLPLHRGAGGGTPYVGIGIGICIRCSSTAPVYAGNNLKYNQRIIQQRQESVA